MLGKKLVALLLVAVVVGSGYSQFCTIPTKESLKFDLMDTVIPLIIQAGDAAAAPTVDVFDLRIVCLRFSDQQDLLRGLSVVVHYTCSGHSNCRSGTVVEQIESGCESGQWTNRVEGSTSLTRSESTEANLSTTARDDCSACVSPELASELGVTTDGVTHCVACNSTCDQGLMRCFGFGASDCCNFYNNSVCVEQCLSPFVSNSDSICVCPEGTTGHNCEDDVDCGSLTDPVNGAVTVTNTTFNSTATYSCNGGYNLVGDTTTRTCLASASWSGSKPSCCTSNCIECDEDKCSSCEQNYKLESGICRCATVDGCSICAEDDSSKCDTCDEGLRLSEDNSACITGRDDGNGLSPGAIVGIIIAIIVVAILLALLTALIIFLAKRYWDKVHLKTTELESGPSNHHLNPLYVKPTDLDDVDKGAITPNGKSAPSISTGGEGGGEGEGAVEPDSNGSE
jgi:hypothetical protein